MSDMKQELEKTEQVSDTETEDGQYRELREALMRLGEAEPGLICQTTKDGKPEVIIIPGRDNEIVQNHEEPHDPRDIVVAISDDDIRILDIIPRYYPSVNRSGKLFTIQEPTSDFFRPDKSGNIRTEEEIIGEIGFGGIGRGNIWERRHENSETKLRFLLDSLYNRNEANQHNREPYGEKLAPDQLERFATLRQAFDPKSFDPSENLAARFNALAQKLSTSVQKA